MLGVSGDGPAHVGEEIIQTQPRVSMEALRVEVLHGVLLGLREAVMAVEAVGHEAHVRYRGRPRGVRWE